MMVVRSTVLSLIYYGGWWLFQKHSGGFLIKMAYTAMDTDGIAYCLCFCCFVRGSGAGECIRAQCMAESLIVLIRNEEIRPLCLNN
jgi:hypothetical protein